jgi:hypothetical protein
MFEDELRRHMINWTDYGLDSTFFWYDALCALRDPERKLLGADLRSEEHRKQLPLEDREKLLSPDEARKLLELPRRYWVDLGQCGGFRASLRDDEPSVYASRIALALLKVLKGVPLHGSPLGYKSACELFGDSEYVDKTIKFVESCQANEGGFKSSPWSSLPATVRNTHSAFSLLWDLERDGPVSGDVQSFLGLCSAPKAPGEKRDGIGGYSECPQNGCGEAPPITCATYYAVSVLTTIQEAAATALCERIVPFLVECWDDSLGGFKATTSAWSPTDRASLPHTVFSIRSSRRLEGEPWLEELLSARVRQGYRSSVIGFVSSCEGSGGYSLRPASMSGPGRPFSGNVFATYQAVHLAYPTKPDTTVGFSDAVPPREVLDQLRAYPVSERGERQGFFSWPSVGGAAPSHHNRLVTWLANLLLRPSHPITGAMEFTPIPFYLLALAAFPVVVISAILLALILGGALWRPALILVWPVLFLASFSFVLSLSEIILWHLWGKRSGSARSGPTSSAEGHL